MKPNPSLARITGILYLLIILFAGFSEGFIRSSLIIPGDTASTIEQIIQSEALFRFGIVSDLIAFACDAAVAILFYILLKEVNQPIALLAAAFRLIAHPAIATINLLNLFLILFLLNDGGASSFEESQLNQLVQLFIDAHHYGYLIAGVFFGIHCFFLGYLLYHSEAFPRILGMLMVLASMGYLTESFGNTLFPEHEAIYTWIVAVPAVLAEVSLALYLVIKGMDKTKTRPDINS